MSDTAFYGGPFFAGGFFSTPAAPTYSGGNARIGLDNDGIDGARIGINGAGAQKGRAGTVTLRANKGRIGND